ncbi:hypothetical protein ACA910_021221 [Epithemia clementina (nom. ined.)]
MMMMTTRVWTTNDLWKDDGDGQPPPPQTQERQLDANPHPETERELAAWAKPYRIALWGDLPYLGSSANVFDPRDLYGLKYAKLRDSINSRRIEFNIHAGDVKDGSSRCDDHYYRRFEDLINSLDSPGFLTLGDNDWTDCYRANNGNFDPLERLDYVRKRFYNGVKSKFGSAKSHGIATDIYSAKYPELQMWSYNNVLYVTLHIVGSNNALYDGVDYRCNDELAQKDPYCRKAYAESLARTRACVDFMQDAFDFAQEANMAGIMLAMQANPFRCDDKGGESQDCLQYRDSPKFYIPTGFQTLWLTLVAEVNFYEKPVVLFHGDFHFFRVYRDPGGMAPNLRTVMCPGDAKFGWILCDVDPNSPHVFSFTHIDIDGHINS